MDGWGKVINAQAKIDKEEVSTVMGAFDDMWNINTRPVIEMTTLAIAHLIKSKGCVVNVSSIAGMRPRGNGLGPYCVSKTAVDHFTRCTALELAPYGVRINTVNPAVTETPMITGLMSGSREQFDTQMKVGRCLYFEMGCLLCACLDRSPAGKNS